MHSVSYSSIDDFITENSESLEAGGVCLLLDGMANQFDNVECEIHIENPQASITVPGRVLWIAPTPDDRGFRRANIELAGDAKKRVNAFVAALSAGLVPISDGDTGKAGNVSPAEPGGAGGAADDMTAEEAAMTVDDVVITAGGEGNLFAVFDRLSQHEQVKLALAGNRPARNIVLRKGSQLTWRYLIKNPQISEYEVAEIAGMRQMPRDVIEYISKNKEWMKLDSVRIAIIKNPNSPMPLAQRMVPLLKYRDLRMILKTTTLRGPVDSAVKRLLARRKGG